MKERIKKLIKTNIQQVLFVCLAFMAMVLVSYFYLSDIVTGQIQSLGEETMNSMQESVTGSLTGSELVFTNVAQSVETMLMDNQSDEDILSYLINTNAYFTESRSAMEDFLKIYAFTCRKPRYDEIVTINDSNGDPVFFFEDAEGNRIPLKDGDSNLLYFTKDEEGNPVYLVYNYRDAEGRNVCYFRNEENDLIYFYRDADDNLLYLHGGGKGNLALMEDETGAPIPWYEDFEGKREHFVYGEDGRPVYILGDFLDGSGWAPPDDYSPPARPWFTGAVGNNGRIFTSDPYVDAETGGMCITISQQVFDRSGNRTGIVALDLKLDRVTDYISSQKMANDGYGVLLDDKMCFSSHRSLDMVGQRMSEAGGEYPVIAQMIADGKPVSAFRFTDEDGVDSIAFFRTIFNGWHIGIVIPRSSYYSQVYSMGAVLSILGIGLMFALSYILIRMRADKIRSEEESLSKSGFLARMSHEMRTPMNAIIGMTEIANASNDPGKVQYCLDRINTAANHLLGVINDVLDMSKIEAGKLELSETEFLFADLLDQVTSVVDVKIEEKYQLLTVEVDPGIPKALIADRQRLAQVITNLIGNANKFTPNGGHIRLTVRGERESDGKLDGLGERSESNQGRGPGRRGEGDQGKGLGGSGGEPDGSGSGSDGRPGGSGIPSEGDQGRGPDSGSDGKPGDLGNDPGERPGGRYLLRVEVSDNGIGIPKDQQARLFQSFEQVDGSISRKYGGSGLGLAISRKIINMMGGEIWVESEINQGSRFVFTALVGIGYAERIARPDVKPEGEAAAGFLNGRRILLAEDVDINREILIALLAETGVEIECAEDGRQAVEMYSADAGRYDLIFMDIQMPEMDGYEATRFIRAMDDRRAQEIPIVAMTANVFQEDIERCLDAGMNTHVGKPINIDEVKDILRTYLAGTNHEGR